MQRLKRLWLVLSIAWALCVIVPEIVNYHARSPSFTPPPLSSDQGPARDLPGPPAGYTLDQPAGAPIEKILLEALFPLIGGLVAWRLGRFVMRGN